MSEIKNRVKDSGLISFEVSALMPEQDIIDLDIKEQLWQGLVLKERSYRKWIKTHSWENYKNKAVYIHCSSNAIIPSWAYLLILCSISNYTNDYILGSKSDLRKDLIKKNIEKLNITKFKNKRVIIKGCADSLETDYTFFELTRFFLPVVKSLMYGEACSSVPLYKKKN